MTLPTKRTEAELPPGWRWVRLEEVCRDISDGTHFTPAYVSEGIPFLSVKDIREDRLSFADCRQITEKQHHDFCRRCKPEKGDVLYTKVGTTGIAKAIDVDIEFSIFVSVALLKLHSTILPEYLEKVLNSPICRIQAERLTQGMANRNLVLKDLKLITIPLPPLEEQRGIVGVLHEQLAAVDVARAAARARLEAAMALPAAFVRETLRTGLRHWRLLGDCLDEVRGGIGADWSTYPVLGATRDGLAPAKEGVGKAPERYKLVNPVTVFYNPMRILLGSIAMVDDGDATGITSPDYVVIKGRRGILDTRWFYYWFRSAHGAHLIDALSRGAVRERILFNRLAHGKIEIPDYDTQLHASERMKNVRPIIDSITKEIEAIDALPSAILRAVFVVGEG